jgi:ribose 5-phosphate isomerase B
LICGTGQGTALAANKIKGVRAYTAWDEYTAKHARENGDANILTLGARTIDSEKAKKLVKVFLETPFLNKEKYIRRVKKISQLE